MAQQFAHAMSDLAMGAAAVTPSDSADLATPARGIYLGVGGDVKVTMYDGQVVTFPAMAGGVVHWICVTRIWSTSTTASSIVAVL